MADEQNGSGEGTGDGSQGDQGGKGGEEEQFDRDRAMKTIEAQRESERQAKADAAAARAEAREAAEDLAALKAEQEESAKSKQSAEERIARLEAQKKEDDAAARARVARSALKASAASLGAHYPDDVARLVDSSDVKFDKAGEPVNTDSLIASLKESKPKLFGDPVPGSADGGPRGGGSSDKPVGMDDLLRSAAGR